MECEYYNTASIEQFKKFINHVVTSDDFFAKNTEKFDIVFIDGDHSYEQSLKDLNNAMKLIPVGGFIVLHDAVPVSFEATQWEAFKKKQFYNGEIWKTVVSALRSPAASRLQIGTFPYDFGICVIKKLADNVPEIPVIKLDYYKDFSLPALNPTYNLRDFYNKKVSYFTSLYNTPQKSIERTARTLLNQTNPNWEWVLGDDSNNDADATRLQKFFASLNDGRIKYMRFPNSGGFIGLAKRRAATLATGDFLAELDHDDLLMPDLTDTILKNGDGFDFIYSNCASVVVNPDNSLSPGEHFGECGFAMGYGTYRKTVAVNPLNGYAHEFDECIATPINPKTIRRLMAVPNHVRVWSKKFYDAIGGHNIDILVADDYEIIVRSFLNGAKMLHLDMLGYLQVEYPTRSTYGYNDEIQVLANAIAVASDAAIKAEFEKRNMNDWAHKYYGEKFGFAGNYYQNMPWVAGPSGFNGYNYWDVPTDLNATCANCKI